MDAEGLLARFREYVKSRPDEFVEDYQRVSQKVEESSARYLGDPIDFLYQPMFFSPKDLARIERILNQLTLILNKTVEKYRSDERFRRVFPFSKITEDLILANPGYENPFPMARFDIFYDYNQELKFCEFNTDGSAGMNEARVLQNAIYPSRALEFIPDDCEVNFYTPMENWIDKIVDIYHEFRGEEVDPETVAIVDFEGEGINSEFREYKKRFEDRGYRTIIQDPRELEYDGTNLLAGSTRLDLVYRRATTHKIVERYEEVEPFLDAYKDGNVCVVGGFTSQVVHNKSLFAILQEEAYTDFLAEKEEKFIQNHLPFSRIFHDGDSYLKHKLIEEQDRFLLKPFDKFAGHGVYIGEDFEPGKWEDKVDETQGDNYIAQEFCDVPEEELLYVRDNELRFEKFGYLIGLFLYNQELNGLYTRVGRENVIASLVECFTLPNFLVKNCDE
ncbi:glutathionylspermidine synthase family protein [Candidatus Bipolaricaulota bacterium]|nr:glutathionylspermidine synthase family protein [Candidatus Bipolaricaulota bacterium]